MKLFHTQLHHTGLLRAPNCDPLTWLTLHAQLLPANSLAANLFDTHKHNTQQQSLPTHSASPWLTWLTLHEQLLPATLLAANPIHTHKTRNTAVVAAHTFALPWLTWLIMHEQLLPRALLLALHIAGRTHAHQKPYTSAHLQSLVGSPGSRCMRSCCLPPFSPQSLLAAAAAAAHSDSWQRRLLLMLADLHCMLSARVRTASLQCCHPHQEVERVRGPALERGCNEAAAAAAAAVGTGGWGRVFSAAMQQGQQLEMLPQCCVDECVAVHST
jgi:hypothetical protein